MRKKPTTALYHTSKQNPCMANAWLAHSPPLPQYPSVKYNLRPSCICICACFIGVFLFRAGKPCKYIQSKSFLFIPNPIIET